MMLLGYNNYFSSFVYFVSLLGSPPESQLNCLRVNGETCTGLNLAMTKRSFFIHIPTKLAVIDLLRLCCHRAI